MLVEGPKFTSQSLSLAHAAPSELLPGLTEEQKQIALSFRMSEDSYARDLYACQLAEPEWAGIIERLGYLLKSFLNTSLPGALLQSITWQTHQETFRVLVKIGGHSFQFSVRESVVNDLFDGGDKGALDRLSRIVEMASLPCRVQQRAS